jgi:protein arginine N-methyltransferase 1
MLNMNLLNNNRTFPTWHFSMLSDKIRNNTIYEGISSIDVEGKTVFEIGTGAGLIALLFAKRGAKKVVTCELNKDLAELAQYNVNKAGFSNIVTVVNKKSSVLIDSQMLDFSPDIIFTETFDCGVIGEGYLEISKDIQSISNDKTIVLPGLVTQYGCLVNSEIMCGLNSVYDDILGFDLSSINKYSSQSYFPVKASLYNFESMSDTFVLRSYDLKKGDIKVEHIDIQPSVDSVCHGVLSYFVMNFNGVCVSNDVREVSHWHQAFHPFEKPIFLSKSNNYKLVVDLNNKVSIIQN